MAIAEAEIVGLSDKSIINSLFYSSVATEHLPEERDNEAHAVSLDCLANGLGGSSRQHHALGALAKRIAKRVKGNVLIIAAANNDRLLRQSGKRRRRAGGAGSDGAGEIGDTAQGGNKL